MNTALYETYVQILHEELVPAMGCTEPIAVAYAGALARQTLGTLPERIELTVSGNIIKNVKSVIVPHTGGRKGLPVAVAAGVRVGDADAQLEVLANVTEDQLPLLDEYLSAAEITVSKSPLRCPFDIQVRVFAGGDTAFVQIVGSHTNVVRIEKNGEVLLNKPFSEEAAQPPESRRSLTVEDIIGEPLDVHKLYANKKERREKILNLMELVGLNAEHAMRYAHEFSGGQRQRIGIARALALEPKLIICDEAVYALDVSVQAQVLNLLQELKERLGLTYFFISHNLNVVYQVSDRVGVMYLGKMVEIAAYDQLYEKRYHPYTEALLSAIPQVDADDRTERIHLTGEVPSPSDPPSGCPFHTRCPKACDICSKEIPQLKEIEKGHFVACHLYQ